MARTRYLPAAVLPYKVYFCSLYVLNKLILLCFPAAHRKMSHVSYVPHSFDCLQNRSFETLKVFGPKKRLLSLNC